MPVILTFLPASFRLYTDVLNGIKRRINHAFDLQVVDYTVDEATFMRLLEFWKPAGCIVVAAEGLPERLRIGCRSIPAVFIDRTPMTEGNFLDVSQDYAENGREAARELIHPEIGNYAYVGYSAPTDWSRIRGESFAQSVRMQGKNCQTFQLPDDNKTSRTRALEKWLLSLPKPVGIFAANDTTAREIHMICTRNQIGIPDDVTLLGIDNIPAICESVNPGISSIMSDFEQSGWLSADLLIDRLGKPRLRKTRRIYPTLGIVSRGSTRVKQRGIPPPILRALGTIRARACDGLTVADVAAEMSCSQRLAEIRFRQAMGTTIKQSITEVRLDRAKILLRNRGLTFFEIAKTCGYGTENAFRIAYKKRFGTTLSEGRKPNA